MNDNEVDIEYEYKLAIEYLDALRVPSFTKDTGVLYSLRGRIGLLVNMVENYVRNSQKDLDHEHS